MSLSGDREDATQHLEGWEADQESCRSHTFTEDMGEISGFFGCLVTNLCLFLLLIQSEMATNKAEPVTLVLQDGKNAELQCNFSTSVN